MPEYDAFGREIGEDTHSGLGGSDADSKSRARPADEWTAEQLASASAAEAPAAPPPVPVTALQPGSPLQPQQPQAQPPPHQQQQRIQSPSFNVPVSGISMPRRRRSGVGCLVGLVVLAGVIAIPVFAVISLVGDATDTIDSVTGTIDSLDPGAPDEDEPGQPARPPTGIAGTSMVARPHVVRAVRRIERAGIGRIWQFRLAPERLDVVTVKGSRLRTAQINYKGDFTRGPDTPGGAGARPIAFSDIDAAAPARLVRASKRYGVRPKQINYLVLSNLPGIGVRWVAYFKNGVYVAGDRHGRGPQKISG